MFAPPIHFFDPAPFWAFTPFHIVSRPIVYISRLPLFCATIFSPNRRCHILFLPPKGSGVLRGTQSALFFPRNTTPRGRFFPPYSFSPGGVFFGGAFFRGPPNRNAEKISQNPPLRKFRGKISASSNFRPLFPFQPKSVTRPVWKKIPTL